MWSPAGGGQRSSRTDHGGCDRGRQRGHREKTLHVRSTSLAKQPPSLYRQFSRGIRSNFGVSARRLAYGARGAPEARGAYFACPPSLKPAVIHASAMALLSL